MAPEKFKDHSDEMAHDLHRLEEHIGDAEKQLGARRKDADPLGDEAGDWEGEQDRGGGDDPVGAREDADQTAPGCSQDGVRGEDRAGGEQRSDPA